MDDARGDALYGLPLDGFVPARDALAKELKAAGDAAGAKAVRALAKPSVPAWAINQVARAEPGAIDELIAIGERLRLAHEAVLGGGDPAALREATEAERQAVNELARASERILTDAGFAPSVDRRERVADTFFALAADPDARETVRRGRLVKELQRVGFGAFDVAAIAPAQPRAKKPVEPGPDDAEEVGRARAEAERAEAARAATELEARAIEVEARTEALRVDAEDADRVAAKARDEHNRARRESERARREADQARRRLEATD